MIPTGLVVWGFSGNGWSETCGKSVMYVTVVPEEVPSSGLPRRLYVEVGFPGFP